MSDAPIEQRIDAALRRIASGTASMRIPADPTDPDLVLAACGMEISQLRAERDALRERVLALQAESRVLRERAERFRDIAEMVRDAFAERGEAAMAAFGSNAIGHMARQALLTPAEPAPEKAPAPECRHCAAGAPFKSPAGSESYHIIEVGGGSTYARCERAPEAPAPDLVGELVEALGESVGTIEWWHAELESNLHLRNDVARWKTLLARAKEGR